MKINSRLRRVHEKEKLEKILEEFEEFNTWTAGNEEVIWVYIDIYNANFSLLPFYLAGMFYFHGFLNTVYFLLIQGCVDFLRSEVSKIKEPRCLLEKGTVKLIDKKGKVSLQLKFNCLRFTC